jgi:hypothetical protein
MIKSSTSLALPILIFTKMGVDCAYSQVLMYTTSDFPSYLTSQILGICNIFSNLAAVMAPQIAEMDDPIPMWVCFAISFIAMIGAVKQRKSQLETDSDDENDNSFTIL